MFVTSVSPWLQTEVPQMIMDGLLGVNTSLQVDKSISEEQMGFCWGGKMIGLLWPFWYQMMTRVGVQ